LRKPEANPSTASLIIAQIFNSNSPCTKGYFTATFYLCILVTQNALKIVIVRQMTISTINIAWSAGSHLETPITLAFDLLAALNNEAKTKTKRLEIITSIFILQCRFSF
jgi:hypothetical protein